MTSKEKGQEEMALNEDSTSDSLQKKHGYSLMQWFTKGKTKSLWKVLNHVSSALYGILYDIVYERFSLEYTKDAFALFTVTSHLLWRIVRKRWFCLNSS